MQGWSGGNRLKRFDCKFTGVGLATPLLQGHIHGPYRRWRTRMHGAAHRTWQKALLGCCADGLTVPAFDGQCRHALESRAHAYSTRFSGNNVQVFWTIQVAARILHMHAGNCRDILALSLQTESTTGQAIASSAKGRASDEDVWLEGLPVGSDLFDHDFFIVGEISVTAHDCCHDLALISESLFQESPWSECTRMDARRSMGFFFPAQATEKVIEIVPYT